MVVVVVDGELVVDGEDLSIAADLIAKHVERLTRG